MNDIDQDAELVLRRTEPADLETLFAYQFDEGAAWMAAFMNEKWNDKDAYLAKWNKLLANETLNIKTILVDDKVAGMISTWDWDGDLQITYWIGSKYWNKGIATRALQQFLAISPERPIYGRVAFDNIGSAKVLAKCGFKKIGEDTGYAFARQKEIAELVFLLEE